MMNDLLLNINKIHTTIMGKERIKRNLKLANEDIVEYCKQIIRNKDCLCYQRGKNWYCKFDNIILTVNTSSYTIITAHML